MISINSFNTALKSFLLAYCFIFSATYTAEPPKFTRQVEHPKDYYGVEVSKLETLKPADIKSLVEAVIKYTEKEDDACLSDQLYTAFSLLKKSLENRANSHYENSYLLTDARLVALLKRLLNEIDPQNTLWLQLTQVITNLSATRQNENSTQTQHPRDFFSILLKLFKAVEARRAAQENAISSPANKRKKGRAKKSPLVKTPSPCLSPTASLRLHNRDYASTEQHILQPVIYTFASLY